ncbi:hypothetical protein C8R44DRAFT_871528 [Mycena epipterygia]|nr:hypothetical protein C8R44DRAFT_871528 [Mycena epipterygia]
MTAVAVIEFILVRLLPLPSFLQSTSVAIVADWISVCTADGQPKNTVTIIFHLRGGGPLHDAPGLIALLRLTMMLYDFKSRTAHFPSLLRIALFRFRASTRTPSQTLGTFPLGIRVLSVLPHRLGIGQP